MPCGSLDQTTRWLSMIALAVVVAGCGNGDNQSVATSLNLTPAASTSTAAQTSTSNTPPGTTPLASPVATSIMLPGVPPPGGSPAEPGPAAAELCAEGGWPVVASYDLDDGSLRWAACSPGGGLFVMAAASEDTVWVQQIASTTQEYLTFDANSGEALRRSDDPGFASEIPAEADKPVRTPPVIDGMRLTGGQGDPLTGIDAANGTTLWTRPGHLVYDDAWAVGDGAVFAVENDFVPDNPTPPALVAYEVATGDVRWRHDLAAYLWPFHVNGERLLVMWNNLQVLATDDGSLLWATDYPEPSSGFPRMMGGAVNSQSVRSQPREGLSYEAAVSTPSVAVRQPDDCDNVVPWMEGVPGCRFLAGRQGRADSAPSRVSSRIVNWWRRRVRAQPGVAQWLLTRRARPTLGCLTKMLVRAAALVAPPPWRLARWAQHW